MQYNLEKDTILECINTINPEDPIDCMRNIVKDFALEKYKNNIINCKLCNICSSKHSLPIGSTDSPILVVGDMVTNNQLNDEEIYAFDDYQSFQLLFDTFDNLNVDINKLYFTYAINCIMTENNSIRLPYQYEFNNCQKHLDNIIKALKPKVIITIGNIALHCFTDENIQSVFGKWFTKDNIRIMPLYHPLHIKKAETFKTQQEINALNKTFASSIVNVINYIKMNYSEYNIYK